MPRGWRGPWMPKNPFSLIRMSWDPRNLKALLDKTQLPELATKSVFQQRWLSKRELRGYHVPNISERQFLNRHFTAQLPNRMLSPKERLETPPMQSLMFGELERRVDVVVFRSHFADSIWTARKAVRQGHVLVNGEKCTYPCRRLEDGDIVTVKPRAVVTLKNPNKADKESQESDAVTKVADGSKADALQLANGEREFVPHKYMSPWMFTPAYLEVDYKTCSTVFLRSPLAQPREMEIPSPLPPTYHQLLFEFYAQRKRAQIKRRVNEPLVFAGQVVKLKPKFDSIMRMDQQRAKDARMANLKLLREARANERRMQMDAEAASASA